MEKNYTFFNKLEMIIQKLIGKHKTLILCGDWNINLLQSSPYTRELNDLLLWYNFKSAVNIPNRITKNTASLLNVVITNEKKYINSLRVMDLGLSDHYAQIVSILIPKFNNKLYRMKKRKFNETNTQEFHYLLNHVTWQEVCWESEINAKFSAFMEVFLHCYNINFPIKTVHMRNTIKKTIGLFKELKFPVKGCDYLISKERQRFWKRRIWNI